MKLLCPGFCIALLLSHLQQAHLPTPYPRTTTSTFAALFTHLWLCSASQAAVKGGRGDSRESANLPHALHVAQPLKYCSLWRKARSQSLQQFTLLKSSPAPPLASCLSVPLLHSILLDCVARLTGSPLSVCVPFIRFDS